MTRKKWGPFSLVSWIVTLLVLFFGIVNIVPTSKVWTTVFGVIIASFLLGGLTELFIRSLTPKR